MSAESSLEARIRRAEVALVYAQARPGFAISFFNSVVFFVLLAPVVPLTRRVVWLAFMVIVVVARALVVRAHARADEKPEIDSTLWKRRFVVTSFFGGVGWGALGVVLFPPASVAHQLSIGFVLAGLAAGSVSYFSSVPAAYYAFAATALVPYAVRLFVAGGSLGVTLGGLTVLYTVSLAANVRRVHVVIRDSFRVRFANEALVDVMRAEVATRTEAEQRRTESEALFRGAFDSVAAAMCLLDARGRYILVNDAACSLLGYSRAELLTLSPFDLAPAEDRPRYDALFARMNAPDAHASAFEGRVRTKDGLDRWIQGSAQALRNIESKACFVIQFVDVTERRAVETLKSEFIATVSHELRTPLTAIQGAVQLLAGGVAGPLPELATELVTTAAANAVRLRKLVDDLLDIEKLDGNSAAFTRRPTRILRLVDEIVAGVTPFAKGHGVTLRRVGTDDVEIDTDPDRLGQVLTNLLSNAAKFSHAGGVVDVCLQIDDAIATLEVRDHGVGIPESFRERVFQKFSQVDSSDARAKGGTGLGLSISKALVDRLGGKITYESEAGVGTTFRVALPRGARA